MKRNKQRDPLGVLAAILLSVCLLCVLTACQGGETGDAHISAEANTTQEETVDVPTTDGETAEVTVTEEETTEVPDTVCPHEYEETITDATCIADGSKVYRCLHCGDCYTETVSATGHAYQTVTTEATCTADGSVVTACSRCGDTSTEVLPAHGHHYTETVVEATCTADGSVVTVCSRCGDTLTEVLPAHGHHYTETVAEATCTEDGCKTSTCSHCGDVITETLPALGHDTKTKTTNATCTEKGKKVTTCTRCDYTKTETIKAKGHNIKTETTPATCTEEGEKVSTCSRCDYITIETLAPKGHSHKETVTPATCTVNGEKVTTCTACDYRKTEILPAAGHRNRVTTSQPTCTARGKTVTQCTVCGEKSTKYIAQLGHDYHDYVCQRAGCDKENILYISDYGAVGDGVTDDGVAVCNAVNAAKNAHAKLVFEKNKTYYIKTCTNVADPFTSPFALKNASGVTFDGQGATFLLAPELTHMTFMQCSDITVKNCNFDYAVSVYLVGTVKKISGKTITYTTDREPYVDFYDYTGITAFSIRPQSGVQGYPHAFLTTITKTGSKEVTIKHTSGVGNYKVGDKIYLPNPGVGHVGSEAIYFGGNTGTVTLENVEIRAARNFSFSIKNNDATFIFHNVDLTPGAGNDRALKMVGWRDGYHCKDNRQPLHFTDCENGIVFDDVFNIRNTLGSIVSVTNKNVFTAIDVGHSSGDRHVPFGARQGDVIDFYDHIGDVYYGYGTVQSCRVSGGDMIITLDPQNSTVDLAKVDLAACRLGNRMTAAPGSTMKNCHFSGSFRFSREFLAEDCQFDILSIWLLVEGGFEGPIPSNVTFRRCHFNYGNIQIDGYNRWDTKEYLPNLGAQITGIRAYDCTFTNGCYVKTKTGGYMEIYQNGVLQVGTEELRPSSYVSRNDYAYPTAGDIAAGYTFDFSDGNAIEFTVKPEKNYAPINQYTTLDRVHEAAAASMRANGFGENVYFYNQKSYLHSLTGAVEYGKSYRLTMTVYDCAGTLTTSGERGAFVLLKMANGTQKETEVSYTYKVDPDDSRILTLTFEFTIGNEETNDIDFYELSTSPCEFYIGSLTIRQI